MDRMPSRKRVSALTSVYSLARSAGLFQFGWFQSLFVSSYFLYKRFWEDPFWGLLHRRPELFRNGDVLDIGANIGYTASLFARAVDADSRVYAFEPDQESFAVLTRVLRRKNLCDKVIAVNMAVGSTEGSIEFWHNKRHSADHRVVTEHFRGSQLDPAEVTAIPVVTVDGFVRSHHLESVSFLKMDVQGYELAVCEGMRQTLANFPQLTVCFEYAPEALRELGFEPAALLRFFHTGGYRLHVLTRSSINLAEEDAQIEKLAEENGYVDLLASRNQLG